MNFIIFTTQKPQRVRKCDSSQQFASNLNSRNGSVSKFRIDNEFYVQRYMRHQSVTLSSLALQQTPTAPASAGKLRQIRENHMQYFFEDKKPQVDSSAFIAPSAILIGEVTVGENASIWFNTCARGDINHIKIGAQSNVQDNTVLHVTKDQPVEIGERVTVGHSVVLHGCRIEDDCLIGMSAVVLDGAIVKSGSIIAAGAVVAPFTVIPPNSLAMGVPAKVIRKLDERDRQRFQQNWKSYIEYSASYKDDTKFGLVTST